MFWSAVWAGVRDLALLEVWLVALGYGVAMLGFMIAVTHATRDRRDPDQPTATGCVTYVVGGTLLQGILMALVVALLLPILLGGSALTPFERFNWGPLIRGGLLAAVAGVVITILPVIGGITSKIPGALAFIQGIFLFRLETHYAIDQPLITAGIQNAQVYPGFMATVGFLVVGTIVLFLVVLAITALASTLLPRSDAMSAVLAQSVGAAGAVIPLLMYGEYVAAAVAALPR